MQPFLVFLQDPVSVEDLLGYVIALLQALGVYNLVTAMLTAIIVIGLTMRFMGVLGGGGR